MSFDLHSLASGKPSSSQERQPQSQSAWGGQSALTTGAPASQSQLSPVEKLLHEGTAPWYMPTSWPCPCPSRPALVPGAGPPAEAGPAAQVCLFLLQGPAQVFPPLAISLEMLRLLSPASGLPS